MSAGQITQSYEFGPFRLDPLKRLLWRDGEVVSLSPKAFDTLLALIEKRGEVFEKDALIQALWPDSFVEEANLTVKISQLRKALGEQPHEHQYIVTVPGRGYRFVAEVHTISESGVAPVVEPPAQNFPLDEATDPGILAPYVSKTSSGLRSARSRFWLWVLAAMLVGGGLVVAATTLMSSHRQVISTDTEPIRSIAVLPLDNLSGDPTQEYFADGMTEALISNLAQISALKVISRTSVMRYKGTRKSLPEIARELNVDAVIEGHTKPICLANIT